MKYPKKLRIGKIEISFTHYSKYSWEDDPQLVIEAIGYDYDLKALYFYLFNRCLQFKWIK